MILLLLMQVFVCCYADHHYSSPSLIELNYDLGEESLHWPTLRDFTIEKNISVLVDNQFWISHKEFCSTEHVGTHLDAPVHYTKGKWTIDQIPFDRLVDRPAAVIDITGKANTNPDAQIEIEDLMKWESKHGRIVDGSVVIMYSGWGHRFYPNKTSYLGTDNLKDPATYHFPGFGWQASEWLVKNRPIYGIGVDTVSADPGQHNASLAHRLTGEVNIYILENLAYLEQLPASGALLTIMPMKIRDGTGGPARVFARINSGGAGSSIACDSARLSYILFAIWSFVMFMS